MVTSDVISAYADSVTDYFGDREQVVAGFDALSNSVEFVIPVYNEHKQLPSTISTLVSYLNGTRDEHGTSLNDTTPTAFSWHITIADNASTDNTWDVACELTQKYSQHVSALHINRKGRGFALKAAWLTSPAQVVAYMDADLSTGLEHINDLVSCLIDGSYDMAIGSRLMRDSQTTRGPQRELISRTYNALLQAYSGAQFHDAQCGFKAVRSDAFRRIAGQIVDNEWFFDTEMLLLGQYYGMRLREIPVRWVEDTDTTVHIADTALKDLQGMYRMKHTLSNASTSRMYQLRQYATREQCRRDWAFRGSLTPVQALSASA